MNAPFTPDDLMNKGARHPEPCRNFSNAEALRNERWDACRIGIREAGERVPLSLGDSPAISVLPAGVFRASNPFKVVRRVVLPVTVKMIHGRSFEGRAIEGFTHQTVDKVACEVSTSNLHPAVSVLRKFASKNLAANKVAATGARIGSDPAKAGSFNSGKAGNRLPNFARIGIQLGSHNEPRCSFWSGPGAVASSVSGPNFIANPEHNNKRGLSRRRAAEARMYGGSK